MSPNFESLLKFFNTLSDAETSAPAVERKLPKANWLPQVFDWKILMAGASSSGFNSLPRAEDLVDDLSDVESIKSNKAILEFHPRRFHSPEFKLKKFHPYAIAKQDSVGSEGPVSLSPKDFPNKFVTIVTPAIIFGVKERIGIKVCKDEPKAEINWKKEIMQTFALCSSKQFVREFFETLNEKPKVLEEIKNVTPEPVQTVPEPPIQQQKETSQAEEMFDNFLYEPGYDAFKCDTDSDSDSDTENGRNYENLSVELARCKTLNEKENKKETPTNPESTSDEITLAKPEPEPELDTKLAPESEQEIEDKGQQEQPLNYEDNRSISDLPLWTEEDNYGMPEEPLFSQNKSEPETLVSPIPEPEEQDYTEQQEEYSEPEQKECNNWEQPENQEQALPLYPAPGERIYQELFGEDEPANIRDERARRLGLHLDYILDMKIRIAHSINYTGDLDEMDSTPFPALKAAIRSLTLESLMSITPPPDYIVPFLRRPVQMIDPEFFNDCFFSVEPSITTGQKSYKEPEQSPRIYIDEREDEIKTEQSDLFQKGVEKGRFIRELFKKQTSSGNPFRRLKNKYKKFMWDFKSLPLIEDSSENYMNYAGEMHKLFSQTGINMFIDDSLVDAEVEKRWKVKHKHWYQKAASHWKDKAKRKYKARKELQEERERTEMMKENTMREVFYNNELIGGTKYAMKQQEKLKKYLRKI